jgi:dolichol-phosphate mannosyltransferase
VRSFFFIPVYDQARDLPGLIRELRAAPLPCDTLVFVDNGSSDGSEVLMRDSGFAVIRNPTNRGIGYSFVLAAERALREGYDVLGVLAGNGKMLPSEMGRVLGPVLRDEADYVTGSRYMAGGASPNLPAFRKSAIPAVNLFVRSLTGARLTDATCGYKAFRLDLLRRAEFDWRAPWLYTYGWEYYLYAKVILDGGIRWREVPITMRYPKEGPYSKIKPFSGWGAMLRPWVVARLDGAGFRPA